MSGKEAKESKPGCKMKEGEIKVDCDIKNRKRHETAELLLSPHLGENGGDQFDDDEQFTLHTNKRRRSSTSQTAKNPQMNEAFDKVQKEILPGIYLQSNTLQRLQDVSVAKKLHEHKLKFHQVISKGRSQILVLFETEEDAIKLMHNSELLAKIDCKAEKYRRSEFVKGIIRGVDDTIPEHEIKEEIQRNCTPEVVKVKRLTRRIEGISENKLVPTTSIVIIFSGKTLPSTVSIYSVRRRVELFEEKPLVCYNCQQFHHIAKQCKSAKPTCGYCAQQHNTRDCPVDKKIVPPVCANCKGDHVPHSTKCPVMQHKHLLKFKSTLQNTQFLSPNKLQSSQMFPALRTVRGEGSKAQDFEADHLELKPNILPPAVQKARIKKFSEIVAAPHLTDIDKLKNRQEKFISSLPKKQKGSITSANKPQERAGQNLKSEDKKSEDNIEVKMQIDLEQMAPEKLLELCSKVISNKTALTMLVFMFQLIMNLTTVKKNQAELTDVQMLQEQLLNGWKQILDSKTVISIPSEKDSMETEEAASEERNS